MNCWHKWLVDPVETLGLFYALAGRIGGMGKRGFIAAVVVTVILSWIMIASICWNYETNKRAAAREAKEAVQQAAS
jgi:cbb3-type cytochrome oxidase subunit 3